MTKLFLKLSHSPPLFACLGFLAFHFLHAEKVWSLFTLVNQGKKHQKKDFLHKN